MAPRSESGIYRMVDLFTAALTDSCRSVTELTHTLCAGQAVSMRGSIIQSLNLNLDVRRNRKQKPCCAVLRTGKYKVQPRLRSVVERLPVWQTCQKSPREKDYTSNVLNKTGCKEWKAVISPEAVVLTEVSCSPHWKSVHRYSDTRILVKLAFSLVLI